MHETLIFGPNEQNESIKQIKDHMFSQKKKMDTCKKKKCGQLTFFFFHWLSPLKVILFERKKIIGHQM